MIKDFFKKIFPKDFVELLYVPYSMFFKNTRKEALRKCGVQVQINGPIKGTPEFVEMEDFTRIQADTRFTSSGGTVKIKKYTAVGAECLFIPGNHIPTVGLPQFLSITHVNDTQSEIVLEEDVWAGSRCTFLQKAHVGRGAVVAACSLVNKKIPPYAVVGGVPAKVIAVRFNLEQILEHERILYAPEERLERSYLEHLFESEYKGLRTIGTSEMSEEDRLKLNQAKELYNIPIYEGNQ